MPMRDMEWVRICVAVGASSAAESFALPCSLSLGCLAQVRSKVRYFAE